MSAKVIERFTDLCMTFAEKSSEQTLQEFEQLCYESICNMLTTFAKCQELSYREDIPELEKKVDKSKQKEDDDDEEPGIKELR